MISVCIAVCSTTGEVTEGCSTCTDADNDGVIEVFRVHSRVWTEGRQDWMYRWDKVIDYWHHSTRSYRLLSSLKNHFIVFELWPELQTKSILHTHVNRVIVIYIIAQTTLVCRNLRMTAV